MFWMDLLFAVFFTLIFVLLLGGLFRRRSPWPVFYLFMLFLFVIWAGGVWITPFGPPLWQGFWLPFFVMALVFALLIAALLPPRRVSRKTTELGVEEPPVKQGATMVIGAFFWVLLFVMIFAVIANYV